MTTAQIMYRYPPLNKFNREFSLISTKMLITSASRAIIFKYAVGKKLVGFRIYMTDKFGKKKKKKPLNVFTLTKDFSSCYDTQQHFCGNESSNSENALGPQTCSGKWYASLSVIKQLAPCTHFFCTLLSFAMQHFSMSGNEKMFFHQENKNNIKHLAVIHI